MSRLGINCADKDFGLSITWYDGNFWVIDVDKRMGNELTNMNTALGHVLLEACYWLVMKGIGRVTIFVYGRQGRFG